MNTETMNELAQQIKATGLRAFVRKGGDSYAFFTDGKSFGYVQRWVDGHYSISTVHKPNGQTGTGYGMGTHSTLTRKALETAFILAPFWASPRDRASIKKYESLAAFLKEHSWGGGLEEV